MGVAAREAFVQQTEPLEILAGKSGIGGEPVADIAELAFGKTNGNIAEFGADGYFEESFLIGWALDQGVLPAAFHPGFNCAFGQQGSVLVCPFQKKRYLLFQSLTVSVGCPMLRSIILQRASKEPGDVVEPSGVEKTVPIGGFS